MELMMRTGMKESISKEVVIEWVTKGTWQAIFKFIYTGSMDIQTMEEETALEIVCFPHQYEIDLFLV